MLSSPETITAIVSLIIAMGTFFGTIIATRTKASQGIVETLTAHNKYLASQLEDAQGETNDIRDTLREYKVLLSDMYDCSQDVVQHGLLDDSRFDNLRSVLKRVRDLT